MIFAHGPWYTEWYHITEIFLAVPAVTVFTAWVMQQWRGRDK